MRDDSGKTDRGAKAARQARLKSALRDNLKRRKAQARGRAGMTIVTPEDDTSIHNGEITAADARDREE